MSWQKSTKCESAHCVEVKDSEAFADTLVMRSSLWPDSLILVTRDEMRVFLEGVKAGEFDHLIV